MTRGRVAPTQSSRCSGCSNGSEVPSARPTRPEGDRREVVTIEPALFYRLQTASSSVGQATMEGSLKMQSLVRRRRNVSARCPAGANGTGQMPALLSALLDVLSFRWAMESICLPGKGWYIFLEHAYGAHRLIALAVAIGFD
jgi:hypothetical protein